MKNTIFLFLFIFSASLFAQEGKLMLHGKVVSGKSSLAHVSYEVIKDNMIILEGHTQQNGSYRLDLPLGAIYNVAFIKDGYIAKQVAVIAKSDEDIDGQYFFQLDVDLFKVENEDVDHKVLPPVAKLFIEDKEKGFTYDKSYVKWVAERYKEIDQK